MKQTEEIPLHEWDMVQEDQEFWDRAVISIAGGLAPSPDIKRDTLLATTFADALVKARRERMEQRGSGQ